MTDYNQDYFFIRSDDVANTRLPSLSADTNTRERRFRYEPEPVGSAPLIFSNGWKEEYLKRGVKDDVTDILFDGNNFMVRDHMREKLLQLDIPNLHIHPAIYIDDRDEWHEDYWYLTFSKLLDCWDRDASDYDDDPVVAGTATLYGIYSYSLDAKVLDAIPLKDRLLFKMGGAVQAMVVCHKSIAGIFRAGEKTGARLQGITEY
jgi:hypothetical protein